MTLNRSGETELALLQSLTELGIMRAEFPPQCARCCHLPLLHHC